MNDPLSSLKTAPNALKQTIAIFIISVFLSTCGPDFRETVPDNTSCSEWYSGYRENLYSEKYPEKIFEFGENILHNAIFPPGFTPQDKFRANWDDLRPDADDIQSIMGLIWYGYTREPGVLIGFGPRTIEAYIFNDSASYVKKHYPQIYPLCQRKAKTYVQCYQALVNAGAIDSLDEIQTKIELAEAQGEVALCRYSEKGEPRP